MKKILIATLLTGLMAVGSMGQALAIPVNLLPGTTAASVSDALPASTYLTSITSPFLYGLINGSLYQEVRRAHSDGNLIFVYRLTNGGTSDDPLTRLTSWSFKGYTTLVAYVSGSGTAPSQFTRSASGTTMGFDFPDVTGLPIGATSEDMWIKTNAGSYALSESSVQNGGSQNVPTYAPVPEPTSMLLLGIGLIGLAGGKVTKRFKA